MLVSLKALLDKDNTFNYESQQETSADAGPLLFYVTTSDPIPKTLAFLLICGKRFSKAMHLTIMLQY